MPLNNELLVVSGKIIKNNNYIIKHKISQLGRKIEKVNSIIKVTSFSNFVGNLYLSKSITD